MIKKRKTKPNKLESLVANTDAEVCERSVITGHPGNKVNINLGDGNKQK